MKVIDLLNKIANGEEVPKKICYEEYIWTWNGEYYDNKKECLFEDYIDKKYVITEVLTDEIELIEEDKEIEELNLDTDKLRGTETPRAIDYLLESKINELARKLNELKKGK
jgi:hypothetical protein